jgi:hypothetical protein
MYIQDDQDIYNHLINECDYDADLDDNVKYSDIGKFKLKNYMKKRKSKQKIISLTEREKHDLKVNTSKKIRKRIIKDGFDEDLFGILTDDLPTSCSEYDD